MHFIMAECTEMCKHRNEASLQCQSSHSEAADVKNPSRCRIEPGGVPPLAQSLLKKYATSIFSKTVKYSRRLARLISKEENHTPSGVSSRKVGLAMRETRILPRVLTGAAALLLAGYLMFTPVGALRLAMALSGHPVSAITMELTELSGGVLRNNSRRQYKVAVAGAPRVWTVTRCGVLYLGMSGIQL